MTLTIITRNSAYRFQGMVVFRNGDYLGVLVQGTNVTVSQPYGQDFCLAYFRIDTSLPHADFIQGNGTVQTSMVMSVTYGA